nr:MAG TPA: hypothetical protein [Caudoviricetes sp.]
MMVGKLTSPSHHLLYLQHRRPWCERARFLWRARPLRGCHKAPCGFPSRTLCLC